MDLPAAVSCSVSKQENRRDQRTDHAPRQPLRRPPESAARGQARLDRRVDPLVPAERALDGTCRGDGGYELTGVPGELARRCVDVFVVDKKDLANACHANEKVQGMININREAVL